jgi:hypothetical protein
MGVKFLSIPGAARRAIQAIVAEATESANDASSVRLEAAQRG